MRANLRQVPTPRQQQILSLRDRGMTPEDIGSYLGIASSTVIRQLRSVADILRAQQLRRPLKDNPAVFNPRWILVLGALIALLFLPVRAVAAMPVVPLPSVGPLTAQAISDTGDSGYMNGSRVVMPIDGEASSITVYVGMIDAAPNDRYQVAIYTDSGGVPGNLLASSVVAEAVGDAYNRVDIAAVLQANTAYWLMYNTNSTSGDLNNMTYTNGGAGVYATYPFGSFPLVFGSAVAGDWTFGIYLSYVAN